MLTRLMIEQILLKFLYCYHSPNGSRKLNLQLATLRRNEKSWGGLRELAPRQMATEFPFGLVSESFPSFDTLRSYLIIWNCPCTKLNGAVGCL